MKTIIGNNYYLFLLVLIFCSCVEPYEIKNETFDDFLVVEALLTDEIKYQEVNLSRTYGLEEVVANAEENATVIISDSEGVIYDFDEIEPGKYTSRVVFSAKPDVEYRLSIMTNSGRKYGSRPVKLVSEDVVDFKLYAKGRINDVEGLDGVEIYYEGLEVSNENSSYYRYDYVETYKIVAPYWFDETIDFTPGAYPFPGKENDDGRVCFDTNKSNEIILKNTSELQVNLIEPFVIKFNKQINPKIQHRYSLLVTQHVISREAYVYNEILKDFSESGSIFSENQPGVITGNLFSEDNPDETVIGYFEISKTLSKRVYFNYTDFFEDNAFKSRPYFVDLCKIFPVTWNSSFEQPLSLQEMIESGFYIFYYEPVLQVVSPVGCGDCSFFASIVVPDFWEE
jgi:hypothetical protein